MSFTVESAIETLGQAALARHADERFAQRLGDVRTLLSDDLENIERGLEQVAGSLGRRPQRLGVLLTMVDHRTGVTDELVAEVRKRWGRDVFQTEIPHNVRLAVAPGEGRTIFDYEAWSSGGRAYRRLSGEVLRRARRRELL